MLQRFTQNQAEVLDPIDIHSPETGAEHEPPFDPRRRHVHWDRGEGNLVVNVPTSQTIVRRATRSYRPDAQPKLSSALVAVNMACDDSHGELFHNATNDAVLTLRLAIACTLMTEDQDERFTICLDAGGDDWDTDDEDLPLTISQRSLQRMHADWGLDKVQSNSRLHGRD